MSDHVDWLIDDAGPDEDGIFSEDGAEYDGPEQCPYCHGMMVYVGVDDGGGPYGDSVCDQYWCVDCDYAEERNCIEIEEE